MKWLKYLVLGAILFATSSDITFAQKIRFPTDVRYIGGGYIDKQPYFGTLESALNNVKAYATSDRPYVFWLDSDTLNIADWDSVFTESGLTMKDSIDVYYVSVGKIKWAGFGFGGTGSGGGIPISTPTGSTVHYDFWTWTGQLNLAAWQTRIAQDIDSIDQRIWELVVYTDSIFLYIENDTLKFRAGSLSITGWNPDTTTILRTTGNQSKTGTLTFTTGGILFGVGGYIQLPAANYGTQKNLWTASNNVYWYTGADSQQVAMINMDTGEFQHSNVVGYSALTQTVIDSIKYWMKQPHLSLDDGSGVTPNVTGAGVYVKVTPGWTEEEKYRITQVGDSITINSGANGDYLTIIHFVITNAVTDDFTLQIRKNNVAVHTTRFTGQGAGEYATIGTNHYFDDLVAGDDISIYITNTVDADDPVMTYMSWYIQRVHE